ncbi:MAG TPA: siroheme synthase CysG [Gemmatimonadales bacterium]|nr:siroheme synthase CysG [Gemmatimonadales bacterium]
MHYYPVLLDLRDRPCVVVGGGTVAEGKIPALVAAGARVTVVAPALTPGLAAQHRAGRFAHAARGYANGDLAGACLAIGATDDAAVNHAVHAEATRRGILVNVVDDPPYCGFILPSILRRGELVIAVSTSGNAPALAVRLRERLERELGPELARFLELAGSIRAPLAARYPDFQTRRRLWYRLVDSDVLALLRAGDDAGARRRIAGIMGVEPEGAGPSAVTRTLTPADPRAAIARPLGTVHLVGAGPGDPRLITARGLELLRRADVVVYDRLVSAELLEEAPADADLIYVGKAPGGHCMPQDGINALLISAARRGRAVVRLKGGDPFVFGRGADEALACAEAGVPWEVVPGVSSALGATASAAIPVTARGTASAFAVVTAHRAGDADDELDWKALARIETLVILMGVERLEEVVAQLAGAGRALDTPVAIVENGTLPGERVTTGTLGDIARRARAADVRPPAVIVVGDVVRLRALLHGAGAIAGPSLDSLTHESVAAHVA